MAKYELAHPECEVIVIDRNSGSIAARSDLKRSRLLYVHLDKSIEGYR